MTKSISVIEKQIIKDYGDIFIDSKGVLELRGPIIPTTLSLDIALNGGILEGTVVSMAGNPAAGKTTMSLTIAAEAQKLGKKIYYIDVEGRLQPELLATIKGLDVDDVRIIHSIKERFLTAEDYLNIITKLISSEENVFIILDSVAALCAEAAYSTQMGESKQMMGIPTLMYNTLRKAAQTLPAMKSNLILITHVQANPSPYGGPTEMGGNAIKFLASTRISCLSSSEVPKDGDKIGRESKFRIYKSSLGPGTGEAMFYIRYGHGYDREADIVTVAEEMGFLSKTGSWYSMTLDNDPEIKVQGKEKLIEHLRNNPKDAAKLEQSIRQLVFGKQ